jgi:hypothetical protein
VRTIPAAAGLTLAAALAIAGCKPGATPHPGASSAAAKARASASAFAKNPAVAHDEVVALRKMANCTASATHGELAFTVKTGAATGQASIPGVSNTPRVQLTHYSYKLLFHPIKKAEGVVNCAAPKATRHAAWKCVKQLNLPLSKTDVSPWLVGISGCIVGAPQ